MLRFLQPSESLCWTRLGLFWSSYRPSRPTNLRYHYQSPHLILRNPTTTPSRSVRVWTRPRTRRQVTPLDTKKDYFQKYEYFPMMSTTEILNSNPASERRRGPRWDTRQEKLAYMLASGQPDMVMDVLTDPQFSNVVGNLPDSTFIEAFLLLSPAHFIEPYRNIHRALHPTAERLMRIKQLKLIFNDFADNLAKIVRARISAGRFLGRAELTHLLVCAGAMGDIRMAQKAWQVMDSHEVKPDTQCYNHYMEALIWEGAFTGMEKYRLRMTPYAYKQRKYGLAGRGWEGYGTAARSVLREVRGVFEEMVERSIAPDEMTFTNLIIACSRVGYVPGMKDVLKTTWNIDVDELKTEEGWSRLPEVFHQDPASPLRPTSRLLFAVAHAFGTNNDMEAALRLVEAISTQYDIPVPERVWWELFERAYVLSRRRFGPDAERNAKGQISPLIVTKLFDTMTAEPYNVRPTMEARCKLAKMAWESKRLKEFKAQMAAAYEILKETRRNQREARSAIETFIKWRSPRNSHHTWQTRDLANAVYSYNILSVRTAQQTELMNKLAKLLLIQRLWTGRDNPAWQTSIFPKVLEEWKDFLPEEFFFYTGSGVVNFHGPVRWGTQNRYSGKHIPIRRPSPDNDVKPGDEVGYVDDEFFWKGFLRFNPDIKPDSASLKLLFEQVLREDRVASEIEDPHQIESVIFGQQVESGDPEYPK
ncbi:uncharacterized protein BP01DRAFT_358283 [Aspergillus saccharolyticus JOP 1030-1]|uniref:Mitochondrial ATPase expression-domain-containing protein n=1 Tax=Aspergillus saccharolyticus JOP 1030-1 TaxID=1450539 RepID=A0A318Z9E8_9EURO|nr:hypothetical protein BP01DRAFT_358283 [Aspergillus saccharolyticus JOP 1030-1]PYH43849.1 hypothetical protein BP01DRAFT_358283 [Aspergillus saccharolyticus JOP 1030-1]